MSKLIPTSLFAPEILEARTVLDGTGMCGFVDLPDSEWVSFHPDGTSLRFASLTVGRLNDLGGETILQDATLVTVKGQEVSVGQVKEYLHGFADSIGTDMFAEFLDLRFAEWGTGSSPTFQNFEDYIAEQLKSRAECQGLRFATDVSFELPRLENEPFFTGGWLDLPLEGFGTLVTEGDIAEIVESYEITSDETTTLTVPRTFEKSRSRSTWMDR